MASHFFSPAGELEMAVTSYLEKNTFLTAESRPFLGAEKPCNYMLMSKTKRTWQEALRVAPWFTNNNSIAGIYYEGEEDLVSLPQK